MAHSIMPYEGKEPYIFVSYSHNDSAKVFPILEKLESLGYRIWFDKGIELGAEWSESIAVHLSACTVCMAFISQDSAQSMNCRQEIGYALKQKKSILSVFLENADLSMGLDMQLSAYQQIYANQYSDKKLFYDRLNNVPILQPCKRRDLSSEDGDKKQSKTGKRIVILAMAVIALIGLAGAGAWIWMVKGDQQTQTEASSPPYHVILTAGEDCSVREYNSAIDILKGRLDTFAGDMDYKMTVKDDTIDLLLPRELFGDVDLSTALMCYFSRSCELFAFDQRDNSQRVPLSRSDLESVTLKHGAIEGVDAVALGVADEAYPYIEIVLTEKCADRIRREIESWGAYFAFAQDMQMSQWFYFNTFPARDGKTFYILNTDRGGRYSEISAYNLSHESYACHFEHTIVLDDVQWEDPEDPSAGRNQRHGDAITEASVTIPFATSDTPTAGKWIDSEAVFKARLDMLEQPYAIGVREGVPDKLYIKTGLDHMGPEIIPMLCAYGNLELRAAEMCETFFPKSGEIVKLSDESYGIRIQFDQYAQESFNSFASYALENGGDIAVIVNDIPVCATKLDSLPDDGSLTLDRLLFKADGAVHEDDLWILNLLGSILFEQKSPCTFRAETPVFNPGADGVTPTEADFGAADESFIAHKEAFVQMIGDLYPDADVRFNGRQVSIDFDLDIDASLPERGTSIARDIYNEMDFEHSMFTYLGVYLVDEDNATRERARIFFRKNYQEYSFYHEDPNRKFLYAHGAFQNGRLKPFTEDFRQIIFSDPFYANLTDHPNDWLITPAA